MKKKENEEVIFSSQNSFCCHLFIKAQTITRCLCLSLVAGNSVRVKLEVHILETTSLQMSRAAALVAVMGKLHWEEGHTQLESGEWVNGGEGDTEGAKEGQIGMRREDPLDMKWFSWKLAFCALGKRCSLVCWLPPASVTAAQMSIKLAPIYSWFARVIRNIPSLLLMGWHREKGGMEEKKGGRGEDGGRVTYCSLSPWMSSAHLSHIPVGRSEGGEEEESRSFVPWCGSLAHANRAAASGERLAQVLMELGQTHFTAESHRRGG